MQQRFPSTQPFVRNRLTWLAYIMLAYVGFTQSILGPLIPFLRTELHLNYTLGGFLPATLALGLILSGIFGDRFVQRWSRSTVFWIGAVGLAACAVLLGLSRQFEFVLIAVLGMGVSSSLTQVIIQAHLADQHGEQRAIAFAEANVAASLSATLTPLVIGGFQGAGISWRTVPILTVIFLTILAVFFHRDSIPQYFPNRSQAVSSNSNLPLSFWLYWIVLFLVVAVEMSLAVWATDFLANVIGLSRANAALTFGAFPAAMLVGRIAGSRLTRHWPTITLLLGSLGITILGFLLFWLTRVWVFNAVGLFITGLGIANLYPFTLSIAVGLAAEQSNQASARASLGVGTALLSVPLFMGWLADRFGLQNAYGIVTILAVAAVTIVVMNNILPIRRNEVSPL